MNRFLGTVFLVFIALPVFCQENDTVLVWQEQDTIPAFQTLDTIYHLGEEAILQADTLEVKVRKPKSPSRALMYALVLPGLGQAYNGKYWKIPIVWGAMGAAGYAVYYNSGMYRQAVVNYIDNENDSNERIVRGWKRNMELSYIVCVLVYGLQVLDAYVDANLSTWDVNNNLSLGISPTLQPLMSHTTLRGVSGGITCSLKIRGR
jgi:hypothetical protein